MLTKSTVKDFLTVQQEGKRNVQRTVVFYNLDVIFKHINNPFKEGKLDKNVVCAKFAYTTKHMRNIFAERELQENMACTKFAL